MTKIDLTCVEDVFDYVGGSEIDLQHREFALHWFKQGLKVGENTAYQKANADKWAREEYDE